MYKPKLNYTDVAAFFEKWVDPPISNLKHVDAGFVSTIFSFEMDSGASGSEKLIAKFSSHENDGGLEKNRRSSNRILEVAMCFELGALSAIEIGRFKLKQHPYSPRRRSLQQGRELR